MRNVRKPERFIEYVEGVAIRIECCSCKGIFDSCSFNKNKNHSTGFSTICKKCNSEKGRQRYAKKSEEIKQKVKAYRLKNIEVIKEKKKEYTKRVMKEQWWKEKHSEKRRLNCKKWREEKAEYVKKYNKKYKTDNRELCLKIARRRISSKRTQGLNLSIELKDHIAEFSVIVSELNKVHGKRAYHVDHIIPLNHENVCGLHVPWNLQILTSKENCSKSNKFDGTYDNNTWRSDCD